MGESDGYHILEVGVGTGKTLIFTLRRPNYAIDFSQEMLQAGNHKKDRKNISV